MFAGSIKLKLLSSFLFYTFLLVSDVISFSIVLSFNIVPTTISQNELYLIICSIISRLTVLLIAKIVGKLRNKDNKYLSFQHWIAIVTFPIISCFLLILFFYLIRKLNSTDTTLSVVSVIGVICILYFNVIAFALFEYFAERTERDIRERVLKRQVADQIKECQRLNHEKISKKSFLHDLRHHNQLLYDLVKQGNADKALDLISKMISLNENEGDYIQTGNSAITALFNSQLGYAESQDIKIDISEIHLPADVDLEIEDMCIIFANSLENAIEACQKVDKNEKFIKIVLKYRDDRLVYSLSNPTDGNVTRNKNGGFKSSKTTAGEHGLGIENIERAVTKYGGVFYAEHKENIFTLGFSIPAHKTVL
jgi:sensor histidine kinase regulating citrate/malate metabolism